MIDLRSDTLTKPSLEMKRAIYNAEVGDDGRINTSGRSEDSTVRKLEDLSANISGHEAALFCNSGTMANYIAILSHGLNRGDKILTDRYSHVYRSEKAFFNEQLIGLIPCFYPVNNYGIPSPQVIEEYIETEKANILSIENSHNAYGGTCISTDHMKKICEVAHRNGIPVHLDGARVFNAATYFDVDVNLLTAPADSVMFSLSKGLGAPIGSMLCGSHDFIQEARKMRKVLGGSFRQAGVIAAAGIVALENGVERLKTDHENALYLAKEINSQSIKVDLKTVQTNIINADISASGYSAPQIKKNLEQLGLKLNAISDTKVRIVTYKDITKTEIKETVEILKNYFNN